MAGLPPALGRALDAAVEAFEASGITWMVVGSMATRLHGVDGVMPGDVDVLVHPDTPDESLWEVARHLVMASPPPAGVAGGGGLDGFLSTPRRPLAAEGAWTFGRWFVDGGKLEVARIREDLDGGLLETQGRMTWHHRQQVPWRRIVVPVVPVEVQWATITARGQGDRMAAITAAGLPWDEDLARQALADRGLDPHHCRTRP